MRDILPILQARRKESSVSDTWLPAEGRELNVLVLNYTMACPLSCDFCCYGCHDKRQEKMPLSLAHSLIEQAAELQSFSSVGFTGGEPFLFLEEIFELAEHLNRVSLPFTIATAGHWANSFEEAMLILRNLQNLGLSRLNVSHDPSHASFVSSQNIVNAAKAASELGLAIYVVGTFDSPGQSLRHYLSDLIAVPHVHLMDKYVAKVGRAQNKRISQGTYDLDIPLTEMSCYRKVHYDFVIFHDGLAYPCCSTFNRATSGICVGNANVESLAALWRRTESSALFRLMKSSFAEVYELVRLADPDLFKRLPQASDAVGACSLCHLIFKDGALTASIHQVFHEYEQQAIDEVFAHLTDRLGVNLVTSRISQFLNQEEETN